MADPVITIRVLDADGDEVLDLCSNGYYATAAPAHEETWRAMVAVSPWADGDTRFMETLDSQRLPLSVRIEGSSWAQVESRRLALKSATTQALWFLSFEADGVSTVYRAGRADSSSPVTGADVKHRRRFVSLTVPVQPTPTVGLGA